MKKITVLILSSILILAVLAFGSACTEKKVDTPTDIDLNIDNQLSWKSVEGARSYIINVLNVDNGSSNEYTTRKTTYSLSSLPEGDYDIKLRAVAGNREYEDSDWTDVMHFKKGYETGCVYKLIDSTEYLIEKVGRASGEVFIEDIYRNRPVTAIGEGAFRNASKVTKVVFGNNITTIGALAFYNCTALKEIVLTDNVISIGEDAFNSCKSLVSINFPKNITEIPKNLFTYCRSLKNIQLGDNITAIGDNAFSSTGFTQFTIPDTVKTVGIRAFEGCDNLESITIGENVTTIGDHAFAISPLLTEVNFSSSGNLYSIGNSAFYGCATLEEIAIPEGVYSIGSQAFASCEKLANVTLPQSVRTIGAGVIESTKLFNDAIAENPDYVYLDDWLVYVSDNVKTTLVTLNSTVLKEDIKGISNYCFAGSTRIARVSLPASVVSIGSYAFYNCSELYRVDTTDASQLEIIGQWAFADCAKLSNTKLSCENLTVIDSYAFFGCQMLGGIELPENLERIGTYAFANTLMWESPDEQGVVYAGIDDNKWVVGYNTLPDPEDSQPTINITAVTLDSGVVGIADYAFYSCTTLTSVAGLTYAKRIGEGAFMRCSALNMVNIGSGVRAIEYATFAECSSLFRVTLPARLNYIADTAFYKCEILNELDLSECEVSYIGNYAFYRCNGLTTINLGSHLEYLGDCAFSGCKMVNSIIVPDTVTTFGSKVFFGCSSLQEVVLGSNITSIPERTFYNCEALRTVQMGDNLKSIGNYAFYNCYNITSFDFNKVETIGNFAFYGATFQTLDLGDNVKHVGKFAFKGSKDLKSIIIKDNIDYVGNYVFYGCRQMTIYSTISSEEVKEWQNRWNGAYNPVVWDCTLSEDGSYVVSIEVKENTFENFGDATIARAPIREGYVCIGWATSADSQSADYAVLDVCDAPAGTTLYAIWLAAE